MIEILGYQTLLTVHIVSFIFNVIVVILADVLGLLWVLGKVEKLHVSSMRWLHYLVWNGLTVSIITGTALFSDTAAYLLQQPAFLIKVCFVVVLVINSFVISAHISLTTTQPFRLVSSSARRHMLISGLVSTVSWIAVVIAATQIQL